MQEAYSLLLCLKVGRIPHSCPGQAGTPFPVPGGRGTPLPLRKEHGTRDWGTRLKRTWNLWLEVLGMEMGYPPPPKGGQNENITSVILRVKVIIKNEACT